MTEKKSSFTKLWKSFGYALKGIVAAFANGQMNIRIHSLIAIVALILCILLPVSTMEWIIVILCIGLVISAEMINTAIEQLVDVVSPEWNTKAGIVKDVAAGAVLVLATTAFIVGIIIFAPKIIALF